MKNDIDIDISIPSNTRHLRIVGSIGEKIAQEIECPEGVREVLSSQLATVLTEGLVNAIKHANSVIQEDEIHVRINVSNKYLVVRIYDNGVGFDLDAVPSPCFNSSGMEDKGRGIYIIRSLMDTVKYMRSPGGNVLEMRKKLS